MSFTSETRYIGRIPHFVWYRDTGNLVIVVIDDECGYACQNPDNLLDPQLAILPLLREVACSWEETRAIGFFRLMDTRSSADKVLELIDEWLDEITEPDTRVYFLVDALYGPGFGVASNHTIERLTSSYSYPKDHIAYLTRAGAGPVDFLSGYKQFRKAQQADYVLDRRRRNLRPEQFRPDMMSFLDM